MTDNKLSELGNPAWIVGQQEIADFIRGDEALLVRGYDPESTEPALRMYSQEYVSALLAELEAKGKRIAELEASETQLIQERDSSEQALADMYEAATGERPEWSNWFGFADAVEEVAQVAQVEAKLATPVRLSRRYETAGYCIDEHYCQEAADGDYLDRDELIASLREQGFTVEGDE